VTETQLQPDTGLDFVFTDGFESNDFSAWASSATDLGDLSVTQSAALVGARGMQAIIDDTNGIYAADYTPANETRYRARFYFDPNSITMADGDSHYIFYAYNSASTSMMRLQFNRSAGTYRLRANAIKDDGVTWLNTNYATISDAPHVIEFEWWAASAAGASDGGLNLWIDGILQGTLVGIDNDAQNINQIRLGAVSGIDAGTSGTEYFDAFEARRISYIGSATALPDFIVADGFESGDLSGWSSSTTDGGNLSVGACSGLVGSTCMQALINDTNGIYTQDYSPANEPRYRARFYFDPNSVTIPDTNTHYIFYAYDAASTAIMRLQLDKTSMVFRLRARALKDDGVTWLDTSYAAISDAPHVLEFEWWAASAAGANDGGLNFWIDGAQLSLTGIDNDAYRIEKVALGPLSGIDAGTAGTELFDAFEGRRYSSIGSAGTQPDTLFIDGFESNGLTAWYSSSTDSGDLSVTAAAAIDGTKGLQAVIDDANSLYVSNRSPANEPRYRARFYFDPNAMAMASGDAHVIFEASNATQAAFQLYLQYNTTTGYQIRTTTRKDDGAWVNSAYYSFADAPHFIEVDWAAATAAGANNGAASLWIDGELKQTVSGIDNDTYRIDSARIGAISGLDAGTLGTYYFDGFESHHQNYTGAGPAFPDTIFGDGFESGGITAWAYASGTPDVSADASAALAPASGFGLKVVINDTTGTYVRDSSPVNETRYRARFYFHPNNISMGDGDSHVIFRGTPSTDYTFELLFSYSTANGYQLTAQVRKDDNTWVVSSPYPISNAAHFIEIDWAAATAPGVNNGFLTLWIDNDLQQSLTGIDNDTKRMEQARLGAVSSIDATTSGTYYFDAFESRRQSYIGQAATPTTTTTITYTYDPLYRLKRADYNDGSYFEFTYDPVGNRLSQITCLGASPCLPVTTTYTYDNANRLTAVNGTSQTWDANGDLTQDYLGATYTYDVANRLKTFTQNGVASSYTYNGLGDRVSQTVAGTLKNYTLDTSTSLSAGLNAGLTQVLSDGTNTYLYGAGRIGEKQASGFVYHLPDALGSVRQIANGSGAVTLARSYEPFGSGLRSAGGGNSAFAFAGEARDSYIKLLYLRSRWLSTDTGRFTSKDTWRDYSRPLTLNGWNYVNANPINWVDPSGYTPQCPIDRWDCEAVQNVSALKQAFLDSAGRHNKIPTMDKNGFAALLAATIVSERRIGNIPPDSDPRNRRSQMLEDLVVSFGCTVSGSYIKGAVDEGDYGQAWRYFTNQDVPQRATVGIGNVWLETAANIWKGQATSSLGDTTTVQVSKLQTTNAFGVTVDINNPFGPQIACVYGDCAISQPTETESYVKLTTQLLSREMNIEYVAANLEAGALRAIAKGFQPSAFNSATWHLRGVQTDKEIGNSGWDPGGAIYILDDIPTALTVFGITSSWNISLETQYATWDNR
jgi:RHS repeat-associated protein